MYIYIFLFRISNHIDGVQGDGSTQMEIRNIREKFPSSSNSSTKGKEFSRFEICPDPRSRSKRPTEEGAADVGQKMIFRL